MKAAGLEALISRLPIVHIPGRLLRVALLPCRLCKLLRRRYALLMRLLGVACALRCSVTVLHRLRPLGVGLLCTMLRELGSLGVRVCVHLPLRLLGVAVSGRLLLVTVLYRLLCRVPLRLLLGVSIVRLLRITHLRSLLWGITGWVLRVAHRLLPRRVWSIGRCGLLLSRILFLLQEFEFIAGGSIGKEYQENENTTDENGHVGSGWVLNIIGDVSKIWYGEDDLTNNMRRADERSVDRFVRIALGLELVLAGVAFVLYDIHDTVGSDHVGRKAEGDNIVNTERAGIYTANIDQRSGRISRLHGAGKHSVDLETKNPDNGNKKCKNNCQTYQNRGKCPQRFLIAFAHATPPVSC